MITTIILTYNEAIHIERCIESINAISSQIIIVDSFSEDNTILLSKKFNVEVYQRKFINQAEQFQWALDHCEINNEWILRIDADEFFTKELAKEIESKLHKLPESVNGLVLKRRLYFLDKWIRFGGAYPVKLLRIFKKGKATMDQRFMDEHLILLKGSTMEMDNDFVDHNLKDFSTWVDKHNKYAIREAFEVLNNKYQLTKFKNDTSVSAHKKSLYYKLPIFFRGFMYFFLRYFIKLGFLDGIRGFIWHFFQGLWFRNLVDVKIYEIEKKSDGDKRLMLRIFEEEYNLKF